MDDGDENFKSIDHTSQEHTIEIMMNLQLQSLE
jgi:hypothetical protein